MLQAPAEALAEEFRVDWNSHDMDAMGQLLTADADFVNVLGMHLKGRAQSSRVTGKFTERSSRTVSG
jgi:uncharacterized protein (TIGR02246 family)